jgi:MFS family permease
MYEVSASPAPAAPAGPPTAGPGGVQRKGLALALILLAQFLVVVDVSIVTLALPAIQRGLHFPAAGLQWVISGYALAFGGFLLLGGRSADDFRPVRDAGPPVPRHPAAVRHEAPHQARRGERPGR